MIYIAQGPCGRIKVGHSVNPTKRVTQLGHKVRLVHATDVVEEAERVERRAHRVLAMWGCHVKGEWFDASIAQAVDAIAVAQSQLRGDELPLYGRIRIKRSLGGIKPTRILLPLAMMREIEAIQKARMDEPDKGQVVRELVAAGLSDRKRKGKP